MALPTPPLPPLAMRQLVGPTADEAFDNPTGAPLFPGVPLELYQSVFDFGCGCGRLARQLIQQNTAPTRYVGIDIHQEMINWCQKNLVPYAPLFMFHHHNAYNLSLNPKGSLEPIAFPVAQKSFSLVIAYSVFTHLLENQISFYLHEAARILRPNGLLVSTWFLFDKRFYPMMQPFQNTLYINTIDPTNAVIVDQGWLEETSQQAGLVITKIIKPAVRGFQWVIYFSLAHPDKKALAWPHDDGPFGVVRPATPDLP